MAQAGFNPIAPCDTNNKRFVYGIQGIRDLFNVSQVTAQKYKDTFLQPAVMQRGRKIIVDADLAIHLYRQNQLEINPTN